MSEISKLAQNWQQRTQEQSASIEKAVQSAFQGQSERLSEAARSSEKKILDAMHAQSQATIEEYTKTNAKLRGLMLRNWMILFASFLLIALLGMGAIGAMALKLQSQASQISTNKTTLAVMNGKTKGMILNQCGEKKQACVAVKTDKRWESRNGKTTYMLLDKRN